MSNLSGDPFRPHWSMRLALTSVVVGYAPVPGVDICRVPRRKRRALLAAGSVQIDGHAVRIEGTAQPLGGKRAWWVCPLCERRARILYHLDSGLSCRVCADLTYPCRVLHGSYLARAHAARMALERAEREEARRVSDAQRDKVAARWDRAVRAFEDAVEGARAEHELAGRALEVFVDRWDEGRPVSPHYETLCRLVHAQERERGALTSGNSLLMGSEPKARTASPRVDPALGDDTYAR